VNFPPWFTGHALLFDTETTDPNPLDARMVSASLVEIRPEGIGQRMEVLINPGVKIPAEAIAIHHITNERVQAEGIPIASAIRQLEFALRDGWGRGWPVVAFNVNYDATVVCCELERQGLGRPTLGPFLDPFVIDRGCDPYRKGSRKLADAAAFYGVKQEGAHSSAGDALAAGRIVWKQAQLAMKPGKYDALKRLTLEGMQVWQKQAHHARQTNYEQYLATKGKPEVIDKAWPVREQF